MTYHRRRREVDETEALLKPGDFGVIAALVFVVFLIVMFGLFIA